MILVTCATGHLGNLVIEHLLKQIPASRIAAMVRTMPKAQQLKEKGIDIRTGDYSRPESMIHAFKGIEKLLLISSGDFHNRLQQHKNAVDAAKEAGVQHIIYTGVSMKDIDTSPLKPLLGDHFETEDYIRQSGLSYTFLRNSLYADMIPVFMGEKVLETGIYLPAGKGKVPFAVRSEMAEAAAHVLAAKGHEGKIYHIANTDAWSFEDIAGYMTQIAGKEINYISPAADEYIKTLTDAGVPKEYSGMFAGFALAQARGDFEMENSDLEQLLGRKPAPLKVFLQSIYSNN